MTDTRPLEYELLRQLTPAAKLALMNGLIRQAYALKEAWVRHLEPDLPALSASPPRSMLMLKISGSFIDRSAIDDWIDRLGLQAAWVAAESHQAD